MGAAALTYRWIDKSEGTSEEAVLAGVLPSLYNNALLVIVTVIGLMYLLINHQLSSEPYPAKLSADSLVAQGFDRIKVSRFLSREEPE